MTPNEFDKQVRSLINKSLKHKKVSSLAVTLPILEQKANLKATVGNLKRDKGVQHLIDRGYVAEDSIGWIWYRNPGGYITWVARWYINQRDKTYVVYLQDVYKDLIGDSEWPFKYLKT